MINTHKVEQIFEAILWKFRLFTLLPVIFGLISSLMFFVLGSFEVIEGISHNFVFGESGSHDAALIASKVIGGIDNYLIGVVLLIFSFGIYELFVSPLDIRDQYADIRILRITTLNQLKAKLLQVIVMALVVSFFKKVVTVNIQISLDMIYLAVSILIISFSGYLLHLQSHSPYSEHALEHSPEPDLE
ncbi:hypothetical protein O77CONTIG1_00589 [Leptolyngbya sp. O-77]|nr:hypothetical protein O77CONTIG1_00589 [Leptolyngbya sp. O-77]